MCTRLLLGEPAVFIWKVVISHPVKTHRSTEIRESVPSISSQLVADRAQVPGLVRKYSLYEGVFGTLEERCFRKGLPSSLMSASKGREDPLTVHRLLAETVPNLSCTFVFNCQHAQPKLPLWVRVFIRLLSPL